jgi:hypothetical protein
MKGPEAVGVAEAVGVFVTVGELVAVGVTVAVAVGVAVSVEVGVGLAKKDSEGGDSPVNQRMSTTIPIAISTIAMPPIRKGTVFCLLFRYESITFCAESLSLMSIPCLNSANLFPRFYPIFGSFAMNRR